MRKATLTFLVVMVFSMIANLKAVEKKELVYLDNKHVQQYKGIIGLWVNATDLKKLKYYTRKFRSSFSRIERINNIKISDAAGTYVFIPYSKKYHEKLIGLGDGRKTVKSKLNDHVWPITSVDRLTSVLGMRWGEFHPGLDIPAVTGTLILSSLEGKVLRSTYANGYGNLVEIQHRDGYITRYGHNSVNLVKEGDFVKKGQVIALVGSTGRSTGPHVHFEIRCEFIPLDPLDFLPQKKHLKQAHRLKNFKKYKHVIAH